MRQIARPTCPARGLDAPGAVCGQRRRAASCRPCRHFRRERSRASYRAGSRVCIAARTANPSSAVAATTTRGCAFQRGASLALAPLPQDAVRLRQAEKDIARSSPALTEERPRRNARQETTAHVDRHFPAPIFTVPIAVRAITPGAYMSSHHGGRQHEGPHRHRARNIGEWKDGRRRRGLSDPASPDTASRCRRLPQSGRRAHPHRRVGQRAERTDRPWRRRPSDGMLDLQPGGQQIDHAHLAIEIVRHLAADHHDHPVILVQRGEIGRRAPHMVQTVLLSVRPLGRGRQRRMGVP